MTDTTSIPLNKLVAWNGNVRKTAGADTALAELAASIAAHGLLNNLVVRKDKKDIHTVVAGGRRLAALQSLAKAGRLATDHPVPCQVIAADADGTEISLAENAVREQMHPADEFDAFRKLADDGMPTVDIAARFGVPAKHYPDSPPRYQRHAGRVPAQVRDWHVGRHYDHYRDHTGS